MDLSSGDLEGSSEDLTGLKTYTTYSAPLPYDTHNYVYNALLE